MTDDDDEDEFVRNVLDIQANGLEIIESETSDTDTTMPDWMQPA
jgi:hypothetical protein